MNTLLAKKPVYLYLIETFLLETRLDHLRQTFEPKVIAKATQDDNLNADSIFQALVETDPTPQKKFTQWLIQIYLKGNLDIQDLPLASDTILLFLDNVKQLPVEQRSITAYDSLQSLVDVVMQYKGKPPTPSGKERARQLGKEMHSPEHSETFYNSPTMKVIIPKTMKASCYFGINTKWCTSSRNPSENMFDNYYDGGNSIMYIVLIKNENKRFMLYFNERGEFANEENEMLPFADILAEYPELNKVFSKEKIMNAIFPNDLDMYNATPTQLDYISKTPSLAYRYAKGVLRERWPDAEPYIMKDPEWAYAYAENIIDGRWPEAELYIMKSPIWAYEYARYVIDGKWPEAEPYIMKKPEQAFEYSKRIIGGKWPEAEPYIMKNARWAFNYAAFIIKGRWPEAEPYIMKSPIWAAGYAREILGARWPEAEPYIIKNRNARTRYNQEFGINL